ncbi:glycosyltransferase [Arthrobacter sp. MMS18-M83]|uniref:glycosyltransferase n=1 Tax=Arthrobacter sp. MMS18-M83 TaxID=2996261 RepID=UPI00227ACBE8|nr:glycosyltransferase [Arthrobacter sp. MMS18-M83]WAH95947.1 glycosyltransferase [Arthrobacter sp. MMS18-M83]
MRIGLVAPPWIPVPPPAYGGTESIIDILARGLSAAGHDVLLAAASGSTCPVAKVPGPPLADGSRIGNGTDELRHSVYAFAAMEGVDLIHDNTLAGPLYRHRPGGIPLVATAHLPFSAENHDIYQAMATDTAIIAISHHQADTAPGIKTRRVIHHGIDTQSVPLGSGDGGYASFLGRMHPGKGLPEAIEAAKLAQIPLRIAAKMYSAEEHEYYSAVIAPLLGPDVEYLGELNAADKFVLLGGSVALLNPIQWDEPFGMAMIEALATGTPVVATFRGSAPEIVCEGVTGYLGSNPPELASALVAAATLDRGECRRAAETYFGAERMVAEHLELYEELLAEQK